MDLYPANLEFSYAKTFRNKTLPAYSRLLHDVINGEQTLFSHAASVEAAWKIIDQYEDAFSRSPNPLKTYEPGASVIPAENFFSGNCDHWEIP